MAGSVYTVSQVSSYIESMFNNDYLLGRDIQIKGEISQCNRHRSTGHIYFTLKDEKTMISGVMFSSYARALTFQMKQGQKVIVTGRVIAYGAGGKYEIKAWRVIPDGEGEAYERYLALKRKLFEKGMFDPQYKMPLPEMPRTIGVVTSASGAAVQDIIKTAKSRDPGVQILVYGAQVQGQLAAMALIQGLETMQDAGVDVIIIGRGGGSVDDLEAFNDEMLAEAIFSSSVPVISAVGHAINESISDLVADATAITPTEAAQKATVDMHVLQQQMVYRAQRLEDQMQRLLERGRRELAQRKTELERSNPTYRLKLNRQRYEVLRGALQQAMDSQLLQKRTKLQMQREKLQGLSPYEKLSQGYAMAVDDAGKRISSVHMLKEHQQISLHFADGRVRAAVLQIEEEQGNE